MSSLPTARALRRQLRLLRAKERHVRKVKEGLRTAAAGWDFSGKSYSDEAAWDAAHEHRPDEERLLRSDAFPGNPALERALAELHASNRDPRPRLDMIRSLYSSVVFSVASPVGKWDTLDLKPQPFALGQYLALPVFSSLPYLQAFCHKFGHSVRGPDGSLWGSPDVGPSMPLRLNGGTAPQTAKKRKKGSKKTTSKKSAETRRRDAARQAFLDAEHRREIDALDRAASVESFDFANATPLPVHGPFEKPYLYGYFGAATTVFENSQSIEGHLDIVLNPASPLELVLGPLTTRHLIRREGIVERCMRDIDRAVRAELARFFQQHCPEVLAARSVVMPKPMPPDTPPERNEFELVVAIRSRDFDATAQRLAHAKMAGDLVGHETLQLVPHTHMPDHLDAGSTTFYDVETMWQERLADRESGGGLRPLVEGETHLVDSQKTGWGGPLGDIGMAYTEAHAVFTHEYNIRRKVRDQAREEQEEDRAGGEQRGSRNGGGEPGSA